MESSRTPSAELSFDAAALAVRDKTRWKILSVLCDCELIPSGELARKVGVPATNLAKHLAVLRKLRVVEQRIGRLYSLRPEFRVPGERAVDFGPVVLRCDRFGGK